MFQCAASTLNREIKTKTLPLNHTFVELLSDTDYFENLIIESVEHNLIMMMNDYKAIISNCFGKFDISHET